MAQVEFRFYEELNDFLPPGRRKRSFAAETAQNATVKHAIEALGVPHTEVELVLVNGESAGWDRLLGDGDRVAVYPQFEALDVASLLRVRSAPLRETRFIADAHLGRLARYLRFLGFDTAWRNAWSDAELVALAAAQRRIVLTRDRALLMRRDVERGCYVREVQPLRQLRALMDRLDLDPGRERPARCMLCNTLLVEVSRAHALPRLAPGTREHHDRFWHCPQCDKLYWRGSHWHRLRQRLDDEAVWPAGAAAPPGADAA